MRSMKTIGAAVMSVLAFGAISASASAAEFHSTKEGAISASAVNTQVFVTKAGKVECKTLTASGTAPAGSKATQAAVVQYEKCVVYGFIEVKISPAHYLFNANGTVNIQEEIVIEAPGCTDRVPAQTSLGTVTYVNNRGGTVELQASVSKITSHGEGSTCNYAEESVGTYNGNSTVSVAGSELTVS